VRSSASRRGSAKTLCYSNLVTHVVLPLVCVFMLLLSVSACESNPDTVETPIQLNGPEPTSSPVPQSTAAPTGGISGEIRQLIELGTPSSLFRALDVIRSRDLGQTEYGRVMSAVAVRFIQFIYPDIRSQLPPVDPPASHSYTRILLDIERGAYAPPSSESTDYIEHVLPFLSLYTEQRGERILAAEPDLAKAASLSKSSVLDPFFRGLSAERLGRMEAAESFYNEALRRSQECYPAVLGIARIRQAAGKLQEALALLSALLPRYPDSLLIKQEIATLHYLNRDWPKALASIAEILQQDSRNSRFLLMRAHVLVETSQYLQAQPLLDLLAATHANDRLYLLLRAKVQAEGLQNRESAIAYLRSIERQYPGDVEGRAYLAKLLAASSNRAEAEEGRALMASLLELYPSDVLLLDSALQGSLRVGAWKTAQTWVERLLQLRRSEADLQAAVRIYTNLQAYSKAFPLALELWQKNPQSWEYAAIYAQALLDNGRTEEASSFITTQLNQAASAQAKSRFFFLRSKLAVTEDVRLSDLRSSLFEDPRNVDALIAMLELYHQKKDARRAVYYLKQALALAPDNLLLQNYKKQYQSDL
jgi:thioredoxin-like negative regulator of GroEL